MSKPFPIEALEPEAGEAFAAGVTPLEAILYSLAVSARRFVDVFCPEIARQRGQAGDEQ